MSGSRVQDHRVGQSSGAIEPEVRLFREPGHGMGGEKFRSGPGCGGFAGYGFGAVFAKFEGRPVGIWVWPGAAGAVEAAFLIELGEGSGSVQRAGLGEDVAQGVGDGGQSGGGCRRGLDSDFSGQRVGGLGVDGGRCFGHESDEEERFSGPALPVRRLVIKRVRVRKANGWSVSMWCAA